MTNVGSSLGKSVLIVEDDYIFQSELERAFRRAGFGILGPMKVAAARAALASFRNGSHPDAIVLGVGMVGSELRALTGELRALNVPLVLFSPLGLVGPPEELAGLPHWTTLRGYDGLAADVRRRIESARPVS